jgi:Zn-dependent M28 family amino/carboxypeptidase
MLAYAALLLVLSGALAGAFYFYGIRMPGVSYSGPLPALSAESEMRRERLRAHVQVLAQEIGERHPGAPHKLNQAADYIERQFAEFEYVPQSEIINAKGYRNIVVDLYGNENRNAILVIGAHYDTTWLTPGADDNASGVAALLEIARSFRGRPLPITLRFAAFANEEFPYYGTPDMGSLYHAQRAREQEENIVGMFSLEMLGYYSDQPRSQTYPRPIRAFYPRTGNFIAFVSNIVSRPLLVDAITAFRDQARFPTQGLAAPQWLVRGVRRSDHASFWMHGFQAVMITDTANYRNYGYHNVGDTPDTLDYDRMTMVVEGIMAMLEILAGEYR